MVIGTAIFADEFNPAPQKIQCVMVVFVGCVTFSASVLAIGLATLDRYIAIVHPFRYNQLMTARAAKLMVMSVWLYTTVVGSVAGAQAFTRWRHGALCVIDKVTAKEFSWYMAAIYVAVLLFMTYAYIVIGRIMIDHSRRVAAATDQAQLEQLSSFAGTFKVAKIILTVVGVPFLLLSPHILHMVLSEPLRNTHPQLLAILRLMRKGTIFVNMILNLIMYFMKYDEFQVAIRKLFGRNTASKVLGQHHVSHSREANV
ncbi:PREDICTED: probable G-protein coupled receptor 21 [Priapulus caudatus]|uniref:Probable G-protein coupled receptor 21 n=1 Tax=Priapulus caudatus TaxID=37621 RepID=A0ABM1ENG9_PRICU|nr:PREDICTED: probable G-protein coupled receptor 21 [Priapulus caudatus]